MKYKAPVTAIIMLLLTILGASAAESATDLLNRASAKYRGAKSITASYSMNASGESMSGTITVSGSKFVITSPGLTTWFDGKTQWSYSPAANEVNITEPTTEEQQQVNPFAVINAFRTQYKAAYAGAATGRYRRVVLTPVNKRADITRVEINFDTTTLFPTEIKLTERSRRVTVIKVTKAAVGGALPASTFTWPAAKHRGVEVVDLR